MYWILSQFHRNRERASEPEIPRWERLAARPTLEELFARVKSKADRDERIYQAVRVYGYTLKQVVKVVGLSYSTVSVIAKKVAEAQKSKLKTRTPMDVL